MSSEPTSSQPATYERLTPGGPAAIIVYRLCGGGVEPFFRRHIRTSRPIHPDSRTVGRVLRAELVDGDETLDDVLVTFHAPPPVWDLRLHIHGGPALDRRCVALLEAAGFAPPVAKPGPLWPTSSAIEAEAWAALPAMLTDRGMRWLLSQAHRLTAAVKRIAAMDDLAAARRECRALCERRVVMDWFSNPLCVVLAGSPNAGKSTLLNALADRHVSIVSDTPGATRDEVETVSESRGFPVVYIDTAGLRSPGDALEAAGIDRTRRALAAADVIVWVIDATAETRPPEEIVSRCERVVVARNKCDLVANGGAPPNDARLRGFARVAPVSALHRTGLDGLTDAVLDAGRRDAALLEQPAAFTERQIARLSAAATAADLATLRAELGAVLGVRQRAKTADRRRTS